MFVSAGWCKTCVAHDLLFARTTGSGRIFFICAACGSASTEAHTVGDFIYRCHGLLAPNGWTLASMESVEAAGLASLIIGEASENYADLVSHFPGFRLGEKDAEETL
jgi:hypothetical protein